MTRHLLLAAAMSGFVSLAGAQIRVALCGAASSGSASCEWVDVQTKLVATGRFAAVDIVNVTTGGGGTPTLQQLAQYDALLCWTAVTPANNHTWGDVLADYVDQGGGVVVAVFANCTTTATRFIGGRWQTGYEVILDQGGNTSGLAFLGTVHVPQSPLMAGVTAFHGGSSSHRPAATALAPGAQLVASWNDGRVLVAAGPRGNRVDLGFYPPSSSCDATYWTTGGDLLMANALERVARFAGYHPYGTGCTGSLGVPTLAAAPGSRPAVGSTLHLVIGNAPLNAAVMLLGFSSQQYSGIPLPLDLSFLGMTGCSLQADIDRSQFFAGVPPVWPLPIPFDAALLGLNFFNQAGVFDTTAVNPAGLTVTNGGRARIGF